MITTLPGSRAYGTRRLVFPHPPLLVARGFPADAKAVAPDGSVGKYVNARCEYQVVSTQKNYYGFSMVCRSVMMSRP